MQCGLSVLHGESFGAFEAFRVRGDERQPLNNFSCMVLITHQGEGRTCSGRNLVLKALYN